MSIPPRDGYHGLFRQPDIEPTPADLRPGWGQHDTEPTETRPSQGRPGAALLLLTGTAILCAVIAFLTLHIGRAI